MPSVLVNKQQLFAHTLNNLNVAVGNLIYQNCEGSVFIGDDLFMHVDGGRTR